MSDQFVAEIRILPLTFAPKGWAFCDGQLLPLSQNTALFALLGTNYGGNGTSTFALPDLRGSTPLQPGQGPGLSTYDVGQMGGEAAVTLHESEIPMHSHTMAAVSTAATSPAPGASTMLANSGNVPVYASGGNAVKVGALAPAGNTAPHTNRQPYLGVNFCIALQGIFPQRP